MNDQNKKRIKYISIGVLATPVLLVILVLGLILFLLCFLLLDIWLGETSGNNDGNNPHYQEEIFSYKANDMLNITDAVDFVNRGVYLLHDVEVPTISNERIAVRFNTLKEQNIGIIDEWGNIIKNPFLQDPAECFCGQGIPSLKKQTNYGEYIDLSAYGGGIYNCDMEEITLSDAEKEAWIKERAKTRLAGITADLKENSKQQEKIYDYFEEPEDYELRRITRISENDKTYMAELVRIGETKPITYYLFLDENYDLLSNLYYASKEPELFVPPAEGSKIGMAFVKDVGMIYYNIYGKIIWITHCNQASPEHCYTDMIK